MPFLSHFFSLGAVCGYKTGHLDMIIIVLLLLSHYLIATVPSVVTGQAPITLGWTVTSGGKQIKTEDNTHNN